MARRKTLSIKKEDPEEIGSEEAAQSESQAETGGDGENITGRSVFVVNTTAAGISVQTALLAEDGKLIEMPAVFPDVDYALTQIDELRRLVTRHFSEAAKVGGQVIAQQQAAQQAQEDSAGVAEEDTKH